MSIYLVFFRSNIVSTSTDPFLSRRHESTLYCSEPAPSRLPHIEKCVSARSSPQQAVCFFYMDKGIS